MSKDVILEEKVTTNESQVSDNSNELFSKDTTNKNLKGKKESTTKFKLKLFLKRILLIILIFLLITGSYIYKQYFIKTTTMDKKATQKFKYLTAREWVSSDESTILTFSNSGKFSFTNSKSGKAVEDTEQYTNYVYHNSKKLSIYGKKARTSITILVLDRYYLKIRYNGKSLEFSNSLLDESEALEEENSIPSNTWYMCSRCDFVIMDYILYGNTTELTKDYINCYELSDSSMANPGEKEGYVDHPLAKDVRFYSINATTEVLEDNTIIKHNCILNKLSLDKAMKLYSKKELKAYMFVNDDLEINKVIFFSLKLSKSNKSDITESELIKIIDKFEKQNAAFNDQIICVVDDESVNDIDRFIDNDYTTETTSKNNTNTNTNTNANTNAKTNTNTD